MDIEKIHEIVQPLGERLEAFFPDEGYFDLEDAKYLRVSTLSDLMVKVEIQFSYDGVNKGLVLSQRSSSVWLTQKHDVMMRYCRLHVINECQSPNNSLVLCCRLVGKSKKKKLNHVTFESSSESPKPSDIPEVLALPSAEIKDSPQVVLSDSIPTSPIVDPVSHLPVVEEVRFAVENDKRGKSPFARFRKKATLTGSPAIGIKNIPTRDPRFPELIPMNCIMIGGVGNTVKIVPKGSDGEYLMMKNGEPCWCLPYPPVQLSTDSKKLILEGKDEIPEPWII